MTPVEPGGAPQPLAREALVGPDLPGQINADPATLLERIDSVWTVASR